MLKEILQGRFMNHPLHPILIHIPVGLWIASLIFDLLQLATGSAALAAVSYYCIIGGLFGTLLAVPTGLAEYVEIPANTLPKRVATSHLVLNLIVAAVYLASFFWRRSLVGGAPTYVTGWQFFVNLLNVGLLSVSGYLGGLLVYNYGIGYKPQLRNRGKPHLRRIA